MWVGSVSWFTLSVNSGFITGKIFKYCLFMLNVNDIVLQYLFFHMYPSCGHQNQLCISWLGLQLVFTFLLQTVLTSTGYLKTSPSADSEHPLTSVLSFPSWKSLAKMLLNTSREQEEINIIQLCFKPKHQPKRFCNIKNYVYNVITTFSQCKWYWQS